MHLEFSDWYRIASIEQKDIDLKARWAGVEAFAQKSTVAELLNAARLFFGLSLKDPGFLDRFRSPFKSSDDKFPMVDNNAELRVLAGAALVAHFAGSDGRGETAALLLVCGSFHEQRTAPVGDIVRLAREYLTERSAALRDRSRTELPKLDQLRTDLEKQLAAVRQAFQSGGATPTLADPVGNTLQTFSTTVASLIEWAQAQERQQAMRREESDVLWWLFAERSRDVGVPLAKLKVPAAPLVVAKEMADLTSTIPGPYAARGFLDKAVRISLQGLEGKGAVSLADVVAACPAEWKKAAAARSDIDPVEDLCPTCFALRKAVEAGGKKAWQLVFASVTGLRATLKIDPVDLAQQAYEEWLLARAVLRKGER